MKIKVITSEQVENGELIVVDSAHLGSVGFNPAPFLDVSGEPIRLVYCHPDDASRVQEAVEEAQQ